ncbi:MAG: hypothetical protein P8L66_07740 [Rhodospirillaceae bacterium]|nr:hypothetical protein [Rhodospirillaceae bacterium]
MFDQKRGDDHADAIMHCGAAIDAQIKTNGGFVFVTHPYSQL